jgi:hypothetical protein
MTDENPNPAFESSPPPPLKTAEQHAEDAGFFTPRGLGNREWLLAATRAAKRWGIGREMTRAEFDTACAEVAGYRIGVSFPHPVG